MQNKLKLKPIQIIFIILSGICVLFIWSNSLYTAEKSSEQSQRVEQIVAPVLDTIKVEPDSRQLFVRKLAHLSEFFLLGVLLSFSFGGRRLFSSTIISTATAGIDEAIQLFVDGRGAKLTDVLIDTVGAVIGILLVEIFFIIICKCKKKS